MISYTCSISCWHFHATKDIGASEVLMKQMTTRICNCICLVRKYSFISVEFVPNPNESEKMLVRIIHEWNSVWLDSLSELFVARRFSIHFKWNSGISLSLNIASDIYHIGFIVSLGPMYIRQIKIKKGGLIDVPIETIGKAREAETIQLFIENKMKSSPHVITIRFA